MKRINLCKIGLIVLLAVISTQLFSQAQWSKYASLPQGGTIYGLTIDNNGNMYALAGGSEIYYSTNGGTSWSSVPGTLAFYNTTQIKVNKSTGVLYVGTAQGGILWTSDFGTTWSSQPFYTNPVSGFHADIETVGINSSTNAIVCNEPGNIFSSPPGTTIYSSTNGGLSWNSYNPSNFSEAYSLEYLNDTLYAGTENGVFLSATNGSSWTPINAGMSALRVNGITKASNGDLVATVNFNLNTNDTTHCGVYTSNNHGASWVHSNFGLTGKIPTAIATNTITGNIYVTTTNGVFVSTNNGAWWGSFTVGLTNQYASSIDQLPSGELFVGTYKGGVYGYSQTNSSWQQQNNGISLNYIQSFIMNSHSDLFALDGYYGGVYKKDSLSSPWIQKDNFQFVSPNNIASGTLLKKDNSGNLYATFIDGYTGIFMSTNDGNTWTNVGSTIPTNTTNINYTQFTQLVFGPNNEIYTLAEYSGQAHVRAEIFLSTNGGASWSSIFQATDTSASGAFLLTNLAINSIGRIYISYENISLQSFIVTSNDMGATFQSVPSNPSASIFTLVLSKQDSLYMTVNQSSSIYKLDATNIWSMVATCGNNNWNTGDNVSLYFDNLNNMYVYAYTTGVFYSSNSGTTWSNISTGLPNYTAPFSNPILLPLTDLCFDSNDVPYALTYNLDPGSAGSLLGVYRYSAEVTSIANNEKPNENISIYPNPCNNMVSIKSDEPIVKLELMDVTGKVIIENNTAEKYFNTSSLNDGVYFLKIYTQSSTNIQKLIKAK